jgi:hypothetical protein
MSSKAIWWALLAALACAAVALFNYWASYQPLSTLTYSGIVLALCGLANLIFPFRFLGVRKRVVGALILAGGAGLALGALLWPASITRVTQSRTRLDDILPEYQFSERHSAQVHARREQAMQAIRQSTFADMKSLVTLLKIRAVVVRAPFQGIDDLADKRILDAFVRSGYFQDSTEDEIAIFWAWNARANRRPDVHNLKELAAYREQGAVKMAIGFHVEETGDGWCTIRTETRVAVLDDVSRGMARYWRLIVPGSGLLRLQWLEGIKKRAESMPIPRS